MDSIKLEIFRSLFTSVAEEMGVSLRRTSFHPISKNGVTIPVQSLTLGDD
jgi:N-methylhydantoinase B/oxoprolinase/acetone carboxylase alpha subunit